MSEASGKRGRKPSTPNIHKVIDAIRRGAYDEGSGLSNLSSAIQDRNDYLKSEVLKRVREVYGEDAVVSTTRRPNPFLERASRVGGQPRRTAPKTNAEGEEQAGDGDGGDDLMTKLDKVESQMDKPVSDIERRGAMISGIHSSDIAD